MIPIKTGCPDCGTATCMTYEPFKETMTLFCMNCGFETDPYYDLQRLMAAFSGYPHDSIVVDQMAEEVYYDPTWNED